MPLIELPGIWNT